MVPSAPETPNKNRPKRLQWWYVQIADWMIANPGGETKDCAIALGKHRSTISMIMGSDVFKEYYNQRRAQYERDHDFAIRSGLTKIAEASLDILLETINEKRKSIPLVIQEKVTMSALDRLGYGPKSSPTVQVNNVQVNPTQVVVAPVTTAELEAARDIMRAAEDNRRNTVSNYLPPPQVIEGEAEPSADVSDEVSSDPIPLSSE